MPETAAATPDGVEAEPADLPTRPETATAEPAVTSASAVVADPPDVAATTSSVSSTKAPVDATEAPVDRTMIPSVAAGTHSAAPAQTPDGRPGEVGRSRPAGKISRRDAIGAAALVLIVLLVAILSRYASGHGTTSASTANGNPLATIAPASTPSASGTPSAGATVAADAPLSLADQQKAMVSWVQANLSHKAVILADPIDAAALKAVGFTKAIADDTAGSVDWHTVGYAVNTPTGETASSVRRQVAAAAVPLALFSSGPTPVSVAMVMPGGTAGLAQQRTDEGLERRTAGRDLLSNRKITVADAIKAKVNAGDLDIRAFAMLVVLSQNMDLTALAIFDDPAESRAGVPARTITFRVGDVAAAQKIIGALQKPYKPWHVTPSGHEITVDWQPAIMPTPSG